MAGQNQLIQLLSQLTGADTEQEDLLWARIKSFDGAQLLPALRDFYRSCRLYNIRLAVIGVAFQYAKDSNLVYQLMLEALKDRSKWVRCTACGALACLLKREAIFFLKHARRRYKDRETLSSIDAAIDAIAHQNQHYFVDRAHSGKGFYYFYSQKWQP